MIVKYQKKNNYKEKKIFVPNIKISNPLKDLELLSEELKEIAALLAKKKRNIRGYKSMSEDRLLSALKESESLKERKEQIRKEFNESRHKFSKSKINEIKRFTI